MTNPRPDDRMNAFLALLYTEIRISGHYIRNEWWSHQKPLLVVRLEPVHGSSVCVPVSSDLSAGRAVLRGPPNRAT